MALAKHNRAAGVGVTLAAALALFSCGGSSGDGSSSAPNADTPSAAAPTPVEEVSLGEPDVVLKVRTRKGISFEQDRLQAEAGNVAKLVYTNESDVPHNVTIVDGDDVTDPTLIATRTVRDDRTSTVFVLPDEPGKYLFFCRIIGHGPKMKGVLQVK